MHAYYRALVDAGHRVDVLTPRHETYELEGVHYEFMAHHLWPKLQRTDVALSIHGDNASLHKTALSEGRKSVRFVHGTHDSILHKLIKHGEPTLTVFNSYSLAAQVDYDGPQMVCHPYVDTDKFVTTPGDRITLVNMIPAKGVEVFDALARYMPARKFLGVQGGYGDQAQHGRRNVEVIAPTGNVRDDILGRTRILLMPSEHETWGMIGIEAMSCGIPVIAHPTPGLKEALAEGGIFCDRDDLDAWLDTIEALDDPKKYQAAARKSLARVAELKNDDSRARFVASMEGLK